MIPIKLRTDKVPLASILTGCLAGDWPLSDLKMVDFITHSFGGNKGFLIPLLNQGKQLKE